jgi:hypothetical protein
VQALDSSITRFSDCLYTHNTFMNIKKLLAASVPRR